MQLQHICQYIENDPYKYQNMIYFEFLEGYVDLYDYIKNDDHLYTRMTQSEMICNKIKDIVNYFHENNLIHNDIKLENIMINPKNLDIKFIDFGLSVFLDDPLLINENLSTSMNIWVSCEASSKNSASVGNPSVPLGALWVVVKR